MKTSIQTRGAADGCRGQSGKISRQRPGLPLSRIALAMAGLFAAGNVLAAQVDPAELAQLESQANRAGVVRSAATSRGLAAADYKPGSPGTVVLSHGYWQRRFGGDRGVIGKALQVDSSAREIVGVMPASFAFPHASFSATADFWLPLVLNAEDVAQRGGGVGA